MFLQCCTDRIFDVFIDEYEIYKIASTRGEDGDSVMKRCVYWNPPPPRTVKSCTNRCYATVQDIFQKFLGVRIYLIVHSNTWHHGEFRYAVVLTGERKVCYIFNHIGCLIRHKCTFQTSATPNHKQARRNLTE